MHDIAPFFSIVITLAAVVTPIVLFARLLNGSEPGSLAELFKAPTPEPLAARRPGGRPQALELRRSRPLRRLGRTPGRPPAPDGFRTRRDRLRRQPPNGATANRCENCLHQIRTLLTPDTSVPSGTRMLKLPSVARSLPTSIESSV